MGMFDTIYFDKPYLCPECNEKINSTQVKDFENLLETYHLKDVISHAEDIRIIKKELFCNNCVKSTGKNIYIVVNRGILSGIADSLDEGKKLLNDLNFEKLIFWYHDLYEKYKKEKHKKNSYRKFLSDVREWFGDKLYENPPTDLSNIIFIENSKYLKGTKDPIESIEKFLSYDKMKTVLRDMWDEGIETLDIYYPEELSVGDESWSADIFQDEINERCNTNWTWTVITKKELEENEESEDDLYEYDILIEEPFSEQVIINAIEKWLRDRDFEFKVNMIPMEDAKGSGMIKELRERLKNLDKEKFVELNMESLEEELRKDHEEEKNFFKISRIMTNKFNCPYCYQTPIETITSFEKDTIMAIGKGICRRCHHVFDIPKLSDKEIEDILNKRWKLYREGKLRI